MMKKTILLGICTLIAVIVHINVMAVPGTANISLADKPVRIIRGTDVYKANIGVLVQNGDIVETSVAGAQLDVSPDLMMVLGPETKLYLSNIATDAKSRTELVLLNGWVKLFSGSADTTNRIIVTSPAIRIAFASGSTIVHSALDKGEMFAEDGLQVVNEMDRYGKPGSDIKVNREQFAVNSGGQGVKVLARPSKDFLAEMPPYFRDPVTHIPDRLKGARIAAIKERDVDFPDIDDWLSSNFSVKENFVNRFSVRLKDASFRKQLDAKLGQSVEWKTRLHPQVPKDNVVR